MGYCCSYLPDPRSWDRPSVNVCWMSQWVSFRLIFISSSYLQIQGKKGEWLSLFPLPGQIQVSFRTSQSSASSRQSSLTALAHSATSLFWTLMSVLWHKSVLCMAAQFMRLSHHRWKRSYDQGFPLFCVFHYWTKCVCIKCCHQMAPESLPFSENLE